MWKNYSSGYLKHNRSAGVPIILAAFFSALLLSLLCSVFYNLWKYETERIELEEGGWHSRITGEIDAEALEFIRNFAHVNKAVIHTESTNGLEAAGAQKTTGGPATADVPRTTSGPETADALKTADAPETTIDLYFDDWNAVLENTPKIAESLGISPERISYHYALLAMHLIRVPQDPAPRLIFPLFLLITVLASVSLIVIIHSSFAVSMQARVHQFGILSSIGATPKQIRACLLHEAAVLCALPVAAGNLLGILLGMGLIQMTNRFPGGSVPGRHEAVFGYHPLVLAATLLATVLTVLVSAWLPARRLSRLTPLEAIRNAGELQLKRRKRSRLLSRLFGVEGELAGNALKAQRRALRTASAAFLFSFLAFTLMQCFFTLSAISTRETYFERNQDVWDIMTTVKDTPAEAFADTAAIRSLPGVRSAVAYQKASAKRLITEDEISGEMQGFGGFGAASGADVTRTEEGWLVNAPVVILDDDSFLAYCAQIGAQPRLDGAVVLNRIRDVTNPDFRHPKFYPYIKEAKTTALRPAGDSGAKDEAAEIPVISGTDQVPLLREEYATIDYYELVHFLPLSLWKEIGEQIGGAEADTYIRVLGPEHISADELNRLQAEIDRLVSARYTAESENRIQEKELNDRQISGMKLILSGFCALLALIGAGGIFSNALGFVRQREREIARYLSVGMTPAQIRNTFCIEALVIALRPVLVTLPAAAAAVWGMLRASYMETDVFLAEAPYAPVLVFMAAILGSVALAYFLGWQGVKKIRLAQVLQDDTLM